MRDGVIEFLGRIDQQVKIRGFRVEPGEIETVLRAHASVADVTVIAREDVPGDRRLVAYVVAADGFVPDGGGFDAADLRAHLSSRLPAHMVPSAFVTMDALPLTANGKIDRRVLPAPEFVEAPAEYVAPRTAVEALLSGVWSEVLGRDQIGVTEAFWEVGGHSLRAMQIAARVRDALGVDLPLRLFFETPTIAALAEHLVAAETEPGSLERAARLAQISSDTSSIVVRRPDKNPAPLSFAQERLWVIDQLEPGSAAYTISAGLRLRGALDVDALSRAFDEIVRRHEALRTNFVVVDGAPVQVVAPSLIIPLLTIIPIPYAEDDSAEDDSALRAFAAEEAARPFDLAADALIRVRLVKMAEDDHALVILIHHAVTDGWSMALLFGELTTLYGAFSRGEPSPLPELPIQYADFSAWQRAYLDGPEGARQIEWWKQQLAGLPEVLEIPADRPRPPVASHRGAVTSLHLPLSLADALRETSQREGTSLFMTLLAGFSALLHRYTAETDIAVGTPIAGRTRPEAEQLIGDFVNTLVLRTDLDGAPSFRDLLGRVRETTLGAYAHQDLPFERLVDELRPERSLSHAPLFQVLFALQNMGELALRLDGVEVEELSVERGTARFDLALALVEREDGIQVLAEYATDLFERGTVDRMLEHFRALLAAAASNPALSITDLPLLSDGEREVVVSAWNQTAAPYAAGPVHALVSAQAARTPDASAVVGAGDALTYAGLDARSNRLANHLVRGGVVRGDMVAIAMERSPSLLVAMLAVWKAGAAYVPIDPAYPEDRRAYMLGDSGARVVLTDTASVDAIATDARVVVIDRIDLTAEGASTPMVAVDADDLAYVIYTSGSTGRPKGVMVPHGGVINFLASMAREPGISADDVLAAVTSLSFDIAVLELLLPLTVGAKVVIATRDEAMDAAQLSALLADSGATVMQATPATWRMLVQSGWDGDARLAILSGGEALQADLARDLLPRGRGLWNLYGPTETTIWSAVDRVESAESITLGQAIANTQLYVLDPSLRPCPLGVPGELYIGGEGVVRGYLRRPALTAERFVPDAFAKEPGARLYRTGDRVRRRADGALEFLGRIDFQVKVRGFRIELGEIEAALAEHESVREAVAVVREDAPGDARIVAYLVADNVAPAADALRQMLAKRLPDYMVPSAFVVLDAMPLTPNGKVDRKALPAPEWSVDADAYVAPRTATEQTLAALWSELLGVEQVGANDGFFALGGHSLRAARLASRVRTVFAIELPLRAVFEQATLSNIAAEIDRLRALGTTPLPPLEIEDRDGPLPLSFAQQRMWFIDRLEPGTSQYNMPVALRLSGALNGPALARAVGALIQRHESLRTTFAPEGASARQVIAPADEYPLPFENVSTADDPEAEALQRARDEAWTPFDLEHGPLFRAKLLRIGADEHLLVLNMHHAVSDAWSLGILFRELAALYGAFADGLPSPLADLPVQYADFAAWQRAALTGDVLAERLAYWREALAGAPAVLELPTDHPRPAVQTYRGARESVQLDGAMLEAVRGVARREGATVFMTLLAAYQALLGRYSGQDDVVVGTPVAGRTRAETDGVVGLFVNTLALRGDLGGDPSFGALLARVREATLGGLANQELPFEKLVEEVQPERSLGHHPVFQAFFQLVGEESGDGVALSGLHAHLLPLGDETVKFDLSLAAAERPDGLRLELLYNRDLWEPATIRRMLGHLAALLRAAAEAPGTPLSAVPLLSAEERDQVATWEHTPAADTDARSFPERFAAQVRRTPDAPALWFAGATVTYAELDARANRLANHLRRMGIGAEARVGICLERTPELVAGILAVLKAGAAYLPLEPHFPADRITSVLEDAGAALLITSASKGSALELPCPALFIDHPEVRETIATQSERAPDVRIHPEQLAHVIYTSGSTGRPKGVMIRHGSVAAFLSWMHARFPVSTGDAVLGSTSVSFDVHVAELHYTLSGGGTLVLVENALSLAELPAELGIVQAAMVPVAAQELLRLGALPGTLRRLNLAGEPVPSDLARALYAAGVPEVHNLYGPTEDTTYSTHAHMPANGLVTIGRPIGGRRAYVLDSLMQPAPIGITGDLYLAGAGVSRGYLARPGMTAERYLPDVRVPGERMYATGDRARWLPDGELEYFGRSDLQVKVRGFRIEPGEIEAVLRAHPMVRNAVVAARGTESARRLVAWFIAEVDASSSGLAAAQLGAWLRACLPEYMVPASFVRMDEFPRTVSDKIDRNALPDADFGAAAEAWTAPRTPAEQLLAGIFADVLGVERIGADDDFFALGGHSLLAMQIVARVRELVRRELPLRAVFEAPTVARLAERLAGSESVASLPVVPRGEDGPAPLSFAQERLLLIDRLQPGLTAYNISTGLRIRGALDVDALRRALAEIVRRHETLRTRLVIIDGTALQVVDADAALDIPLADLSAVPADARNSALRAFADAEVARPFDLAGDAPLRASLVRLADEDHALLLVIHHTAVDGWSLSLLVRELDALYGAFAAGDASPLAPLPIQYADFAAWQRAHLAGAELDRQVDWWRARLAGLPELLEIPADRPRPAVKSYRGAVHSLALPMELADALRELSRREGSTLFMTLLAGFQALLHRYTGESDFAVGTPVAGRSRPEMEALIGLFVNTLVLRADIDGAPDFRTLLARVRETTLDAWAHQDAPFERLVEALSAERSLGHNPLFQVTFALQNAGDQRPTLRGLQVEHAGAHGGTAQFDLSWSLLETERGLEGTIEYSTDLFDAATVERMADHFAALLASAAADPAAPVASLPMVSVDERAMLASWSGADTPVPADSIDRVFADQAAATPDAVALETADAALTYAELDARAARLARHLRSLGVGHGTRVGLMLERGPSLIEGILATLKAGGVYVPLDPRYPAERLSYMLADAAPAVVLTAWHLADRLPEHAGRTVLLDADADQIAASSAEPLESITGPESAAYVMYTSGSTGTPKGVEVPHRAVVRLVRETDFISHPASDVSFSSRPRRSMRRRSRSGARC